MENVTNTNIDAEQIQQEAKTYSQEQFDKAL